MEDLKVKASIDINAQAEKVWDALINPDKIKVYLGGTETNTDWKPGSTITWQGSMGGQRYQDKGRVIENKPNQLLKFEYWSSFGGYADKPENYSIITYTLDNPADGKVGLTYERVKIPSAEEKKMFEEHLPYFLEAIKDVAEQ